MNFLCCLAAAAAFLCDPISGSFTVTTNYWTNIVQTMRIEPLTVPCPECGGPNHHERHVDDMISYGLAHLTVVADGRTNILTYTVGPTNRFFQTNIVLRNPSVLRQPGFISPPMPLK